MPTVRLAALADAKSAVEAIRSSITLLCVEDHRHDAATLAHWLRNKTVEQFQQWLIEPANFLAVCADGDLVCGVGMIQKSGFIRLCYVRPDRKGQGVGRALLRALEARAASWGLDEIQLTSTATARAFYAKQGYVPHGDPVPGFGLARGYPHRKPLPRADAGARRGP